MKKLKKETALKQKLKDEIIFLNEYTFSLEQKNTLLRKKITHYEQVYLKDTKSEFNKHLQAIMIEVRTIRHKQKKQKS